MPKETSDSSISTAVDSEVSTNRLTPDDTLSIKSRTVKKCPDIPQAERNNWLIHLQYVRGDNEHCKRLITAQLDETQGNCEYALHTQALISRQEGRLQDSLELFRKCTVLNPNNLDNVKQVARSLFLLGNTEMAAEVYEEASQIELNSWEIWQNLGKCYQTLGNVEKAKASLERALQANKREETFLLLGDVHTSAKDYDGALNVLTTAMQFSVQNFPESANVHAALGLLHFKHLSSHRKAFEHLGTALAIEPLHAKALMAAGTILQSNGDFDVALSKYRPIASAAPDTAPLWNNIGMCFFGRKKYVAAIGCLKRGQYLAPMEYIIAYNLGLVHLTMQQYASAFHFLSAAINLNPTVGKTFMLLAVALTYLEDQENAKLAYEQALELDLTDPTLCLNFAVFLYNHDELSASARHLAEFEQRAARFGADQQKSGIDHEIMELANNLGSALAIRKTSDT